MQSNKKIFIGIGFGVLAGLVDIIPMIIQNLPWDANLSAFAMWIVVGICIASIDWRINRILKGIIISFLIFLPSGILIGWKEPLSLIPISIMTLILGGLSGYFISKYTDVK